MSDIKGPFRRMVVLGESTVQGGGWLASDSERWPDILADLIRTAQEEPLEYFNAGLGASVISPASPGYEASAKPSAMERLEGQVIARRPDLLMIAYGLNDMRAGMSVEDFRGQMIELLTRVRVKIDPLVVLVNVYYMTTYQYYPPFNRGSGAMTQLYNAMLQDLARSQGCLYADVWSGEAGSDHMIHLDTAHANKLGSMVIAHRVFEAVARGCPGIARNIRRRDENTEWSRKIRDWQKTYREPSDTSRPGH